MDFDSNFKKRKVSEDSTHTDTESLFDTLNNDADNAHYNSIEVAPPLKNDFTLNLFAEIGLSNLNYACDFYDASQGYPGGLKMSSQYNLLAVILPRRDDHIFSYKQLLGPDGKTDPMKWATFMNYRTNRGSVRSSDGNATKSTFAWMELALYMPETLIPAQVLQHHRDALTSLQVDSDNMFVTQTGSSHLLRARVCKPFTQTLVQMMSTPQVCDILDSHCLPVVLLHKFIVQKVPNNGGYVLTSQTGRAQSSVHVVGSIQQLSFLPLGLEGMTIIN